MEASKNTPKLTTFFPVLNKLEVVMRENEHLKNQLVLAMRSTPNKPVVQLSGLLKDLYECAVSNSGKKPRGIRPIEEIKDMGTLLYLLSGKMSYEILCSNLPFPAVSTVRAKVHSNQLTMEGEFRIKALKNYLVTRGYPMKVVLSEDGTRLVGRVLYHPATNQVVGFVPKLDENGVPVLSSFPATSSSVMANYFQQNELSNYAYVIMAQPLSSKAPPFCLCVFGTNNKFTHAQVAQRWKYVKAALNEEGISVIGRASDGDSRLMKAMRLKSFIRPNPTTAWAWFQMNRETDFVCIQDFVHILVKLKSRLLKPSIILPVGPTTVASKGHLTEATLRYTRDQHDIAPSFLDNRDKMNFRSADKICSKKATEFLKSSQIENCEGTVVYLELMRSVYMSFADPSLAPLQRVEMIWEEVFFLRFWREWIVNSNGDYILSRNFLTLNAYMCIEINAHALIQLIIMLRDAEACELFLPWLFSSQPCESLFRLLRALTSTLSTQVNFSILELLYKLRRLDFMSEAFYKLKDKYQFPRNMKAFEAVQGKEFICITLPENYEIEASIHSAFKRAADRAVKLKILKCVPKKIPAANLPFNLPDDVDLGDDDDDEEIAEDDEDIACTLDDDDPGGENEAMADLIEDIMIVSTGPIGVKTFNNIDVSPTSPFVRVKDDSGNEAVIKKSSYLMLLSSGDVHLSSDRLERVKASVQKAATINPLSTGLESAVKEERVTVGDWCAFLSENRTLSIGRIISFSYLLVGSTWKRQEYRGNSATVQDQTDPRKVGCMCTWYTADSKGYLHNDSMEVQGYYDLSNYVCTLPRPSTTSNGKLQLKCSLNDIFKLGKGRLRH